MEEDITKKPLVEIITEMSKLEQKIQLEVMKYNILANELTRRFPDLKNNEEFREKEIKLK